MTDPLSPRNWREALDWFVQEQQKPFGTAPTPSGNWGGYCLMDSRIPYGIPAMFGTAWSSWLGADEEAKHYTSNLSDAPIGAALISKGSNPAGHIWIKARPFSTGPMAAWSNDLVRYGMLDKVHLHAPRDKWGQQIIGWMDEINGYDLRLKTDQPPKPKQDKRYKAIDLAINRMERALETAINQQQAKDARMLRREITDLKELYRELRHF